MKDIELAKNGAAHFTRNLTNSLERGDIEEKSWFQTLNQFVTQKYINANNPIAQSGHSGTEEHWKYARDIILKAINQSGSFLDIGCANGYLLECLSHWFQQDLSLDLYGLDISEALLKIAANRNPQWSHKFFYGNALYWKPGQLFDFVRTGMEYVPPSRKGDYLKHLFQNYLKDDGRLIIGTYNEEVGRDTIKDEVESLGYCVAGTVERKHYHDERLVYRVLWIDGPIL